MSEQLPEAIPFTAADVGFVSIAGQSSWPFLSYPHQILWVEDRVAITNTGRNAIAVINPLDQSVVQRRYGSALFDKLSATSFEGDHLNSLFYNKGVLYIVAHNFHKGSFVIEVLWPSLDEINRWPIANATGVHNLWIENDGRFVTCDSNNGTLIDARTGAVLWSSQRQGYTRGLAATGDIIFVGHSDKTTRVLRGGSETGVYLIDRHDFTTIDYRYCGRFGGVEDVRVVDLPDACHHGQPLSPSVLADLRASRNQLEASATKQRLETIRAAEKFSREWTFVVGMADVNDEGRIRSDSDELLLCLSRYPGNEIKGRLCWQAAGTWGGHASLVVRYTGPEDTNMAAALFERAHSGAVTASLWINRDGWQRITHRTLSEDETRSGDGPERSIAVGFRCEGRCLTLELNDEPLLSASDIDLPPSKALGIRMLGAGFEFRDIKCNDDTII